MFLGWYDPDKKRPARQKLAEALERYTEKFGSAAETCLASPTDAAELTADAAAPAITVRGVSYLPRHTYYVGIEEPEASLSAAA